jgi:hypothetical protein
MGGGGGRKVDTESGVDSVDSAMVLAVDRADVDAEALGVRPLMHSRELPV